MIDLPLHSIDLEIVFPSGFAVENIASAINADNSAAFIQRSESSIKSNKNILCLNIDAKDKIALKASFNSYFKLISLCCDIKEVF